MDIDKGTIAVETTTTTTTNLTTTKTNEQTCDTVMKGVSPADDKTDEVKENTVVNQTKTSAVEGDEVSKMESDVMNETPTDEYHYLKKGEYSSEMFKVCSSPPPLISC